MKIRSLLAAIAVVCLLGAGAAPSAHAQARCFVTFTGAYNDTTIYAMCDTVTSGGSTYLSLVGTNQHNTPASNPGDWLSLGSGGGGGGGTGNMDWQGTYAGGTTYAANAVVLSGSDTYLSLVSSNTGHTPASSPSQWVLFAIWGTPPGSESRWVASATCNGGVAYSSGLSTYDNQQPTLGCISSATSAAAYMSFTAAASSPQYASATFATPPFWTGSDLTFTFAAVATTGNVAWILESGCTNAGGDVSTITFGTPVTVTTAASGTTLRLVNTATTASFVVPGTNGCAAGTTGAGSLVTYRVHRAQTSPDTASGDAHLLGVTLTTHRSQ